MTEWEKRFHIEAPLCENGKLNRWTRARIRIRATAGLGKDAFIMTHYIIPLVIEIRFFGGHSCGKAGPL